MAVFEDFIRKVWVESWRNYSQVLHVAGTQLPTFSLNLFRGQLAIIIRQQGEGYGLKDRIAAFAG